MNILEWTLYLAAGLMALSQLTRIEEKSYQNIVAAVAVFLAWFNYLLFLQRLIIITNNYHQIEKYKYASVTIMRPIMRSIPRAGHIFLSKQHNIT